MKKWIALTLALICLFGTSALGATLPMDLSGGAPLLLENLKETEYEDPTIRCTIETDFFKSTQYWVARVKIADPSQLRTISAGGFDASMVMSGTAMAKRVNAVLAINGDYFSYEKTGYTLRQGVVYSEAPNGKRDVLIIDDKGDFRVLRKAKLEDVQKELSACTAANVFTFGPALVLDGQVVTDNYALGMRFNEGAQRTCIAQTGPLEYLCVVTLGPGNGGAGLTIPEFCGLVQSLGVKTAYNLDGGYSSMLAFAGEKVNDPVGKKHRDISDIIYFASAQEQEPTK